MSVASPDIPAQGRDIARIYDRVTDILALTVACGSIAFVFGAVIWDVSVRMLGFQPPVWTSAVTEYAMLAMTMAISPWLARHRVNVRIEVLLNGLPRRASRWVDRAALLLAAAVCLIVAIVAAKMGLQSAARAEMDIRAIELPRWALFALLTGGFGLTATELLRQAIAPDRPAIQPETGGA